MILNVSGTVDEIIAFGRLLEKARKESIAEISEQIRIHIKANRFIDAIKQRRLETGEGLKEAKDFCEQLRERMRATGDMK